MVPIPVGQQDDVDEERNLGHQANPDSNQFDDPYPVPENNFGWSAGDAAYAFGKWDLAPDEALVIEGTSPECAFWSLNPWSPFLHRFNYDYERLTLNHGQAVSTTTARSRSSWPTSSPTTPTASPCRATAGASSASAGSCPRRSPTPSARGSSRSARSPPLRLTEWPAGSGRSRMVSSSQ